jgi:phenylacetic acid degradation operon negative regulatory protein
MTTLDDLTSRQSGATSLLLTVLGEFVTPAGGSVWTSTIVAGLETVGITEGNARQAVARLGEQGIVEPERVGRRTRWHLTDSGRRLLVTGAERIYSFGRRADGWDGTWLLVICAIPETQRGVRHRFRTQLTFEGFGFLSPTIAVSPHVDREKAANDIIAGLDLAESAITFVGASGILTPDRAILATAWDLDELAERYARFVAEFDDAARPEGSDADAFGEVVLLVDAWRRFPFADPELPSELLPDGWVGTRAQRVFDARRAARRDRAAAWYAALDDVAI